MPSFGPQIERPLAEHDRLLRHRHAGFGRVIGVVQADADELADLPDARADARLARRQRQRSRIDRAQPRETRVGQHIAGQVRHLRDRSRIRPSASSIRLFLAGRAIAKQFHRGQPLLSNGTGFRPTRPFAAARRTDCRSSIARVDAASGMPSTREARAGAAIAAPYGSMARIERRPPVCASATTARHPRHGPAHTGRLHARPHRRWPASLCTIGRAP